MEQLVHDVYIQYHSRQVEKGPDTRVSWLLSAVRVTLSELIRRFPRRRHADDDVEFSRWPRTPTYLRAPWSLSEIIAGNSTVSDSVERPEKVP